MKKLKCVIIVILCICLTGCGSKDAETCKSVVEDFLTAYQKLDSTAGEYLANRTEEIQFLGVQAFLMQDWL